MSGSSLNHTRAAMLLAICLAGCTTGYYRKSADKEAYATIRSKSPLVQNMDPHFTIEQTNAPPLEGLRTTDQVDGFLGPEGERERGASVLRLEDALRIAVQNSRSYQSRKEQLYLSALSLTLARHQFAPLFSASGSANYGGQTERAVTVTVDQATGEPKIVLSDNLVEQQRVSASGDLNASWLIRDVGRITTALSVDFIRFVTGDPRASSSSRLSATFLRPLLRDAGYKQEKEALTQAERDLLYDLRDFTAYRKDFTVQIASAYYGVLGSRDQVRNSYLNLQSSKKNAERSRALAQEGRMTQSDLGRLGQQELSTESAWVNALRGYEQALDNFKSQLAIPIQTHIVLDDRELASLTIRDPGLTLDDALKVAMVARLDYLNLKDRADDALRKVDLAANLLKPRVDLSSSVTLNSDPARNTGVQLPELDRYSWNAGLNVDPGLDRKSERNAYRSSLIARNQALRQVAARQDDITVAVRNSWRTLDQAKRNYEISQLGVKLAERRVEEQNLLAELGRAKAQDQVDAQNALIDSKNQLTQAIVTHTISRLQFWNNLGILYVKENGQWEEGAHAQN